MPSGLIEIVKVRIVQIAKNIRHSLKAIMIIALVAVQKWGRNKMRLIDLDIVESRRQNE